MVGKTISHYKVIEKKDQSCSITQQFKGGNDEGKRKDAQRG